MLERVNAGGWVGVVRHELMVLGLALEVSSELRCAIMHVAGLVLKWFYTLSNVSRFVDRLDGFDMSRSHDG